MHIAIDARIISSSTGRYIERLLTYLQDVDDENHYSILVRKKDLDFWKPKGTNFRIVEADFADYSFSEQFGMLKTLNSLKPDLVHFCMPQQPVLYRGKKVTTIHDLTLLKTYNSDKNWFIYHIKQLVGWFVFKSVIKRSDYIITDSMYSQKEIERFSKKASGKIKTIHLAADTMKSDSLTPYPHPFKNFIMYVGQQSDYKNLKRLGDAHQKLLAKYPDLGLILVGRKNAASAKNEAYFNKMDYKNILFTGFVEDDQRDWLYKNCAAYVFPSLMEGFGLPGLEAMGYGAPVVSSNQTCLPEIYEDAAYYFDPYDVDDIVQKIDEVLSDEALRNKLIQKGSERLKDFSWEQMAKETRDIYRKVLG